MAGPDVLGISSGASLGVAFVILGFSANISLESLKGLGNWILVAASWIGAGAVMILIMFISSRVKRYNDNSYSWNNAFKRNICNCHNNAVFQQ